MRSNQTNHLVRPSPSGNAVPPTVRRFPIDSDMRRNMIGGGTCHAHNRGTEMSKWLLGVGTGIVVALVAGFILLNMEYSWFVRPSDANSPESPSALAETLVPAEDPVPAESGDANSAESESGTGSRPGEATVSAPPALDNQVITEARIEVKGKQVSPSVWRAGGPPSYTAHVFTEAGEIEYNSGCYVHWELYNNGVLRTTGDTSCSVAGGWSSAWWPNSTRLESGDVRVIGSIATDWGESTSVETVFAVQRD